MNDLEQKILKDCCDLNENLSINVYENENIFVYRSRFLSVDFKNKFLIIDEPSPETSGAKPLSKGQDIELFFEYKTFRYLMFSRILDHTMFKIRNRGFYALKVFLANELKDGERREYFRIQTPMKPPVKVRFFIYKKGEDKPVMSSIMENVPREYEADMYDISGGGFSIHGKTLDRQIPLEKGDIILAKFRLKPDMDEMELWSEVRNKRKLKGTEIVVFGFHFLKSDKNKFLKNHRNKIMRYVIERQRELMF